jgi:UDP-galactopyranose mutase
VTEFKRLTGQEHPTKSTLVYEFPQGEGDPYYPVPRPENAELYKKYQALAEATPDVQFVGRLATYKYYNMDQVVGQALSVYARLAGQKRAEATRATLAAPSQSRIVRQRADVAEVAEIASRRGA